MKYGSDSDLMLLHVVVKMKEKTNYTKIENHEDELDQLLDGLDEKEEETDKDDDDKHPFMMFKLSDESGNYVMQIMSDSVECFDLRYTKAISQRFNITQQIARSLNKILVNYQSLYLGITVDNKLLIKLITNPEMYISGDSKVFIEESDDGENLEILYEYELYSLESE